MKKSIVLLFNLFSIFFIFGKVEYFSQPNSAWSIQIELDDFSIKENKFIESINGRNIFFSHNTNGINGVLTIEPAVEETGRKLSDMYSKEVQVQYSRRVIQLKKTQLDSKSILSYKIKAIEGVDTVNKIICMVRDGVQIVLYLTSDTDNVDFERVAEIVIDSFNISEEYVSSFLDYFAFAKEFFFNQNFFKAVEYFSLMLSFANIESRLTLDEYLDFITLSAYSYSVTGAQNTALEILKKGISVYPDEPVLYYSVAGIMAEYHLYEEFLENIELAFFYATKKGTVLELPNPLEDSAFQGILSDQDLRQRLNRIMLNALILM